MDLILRDTRSEASDMLSFIFEPRSSFSWQAGQYLKYTLPHPNADDRGEERYFSIASAPHERVVMLTTRFAANGSSFKRALRKMRPGDEIKADELDGDFVITEPGRNYIFIAGGVGITPFRSILLDLQHRAEPINVTLLYANRNQDFAFKAELEPLCGSGSSFEIEYFVYPRRIDENTIRRVDQARKDSLFYISGPEPMVEAFDTMLAQMGIPESRIKNDFFPGYDWPGDEPKSVARPVSAEKR